jgi:hypothetical protein
VDTEGEDHIYDECRYVCMENPCAAPVVEIPEPLDLRDPLDQRVNPYARRTQYR